MQASLDLLKEASVELNDFIGSTVEVVHCPIDPLQFYRDYMAANKPCLIKGALDEWPATRLWTTKYLKKRLERVQVPVAVTPNGRADAVTKLPHSDQHVFALPADGTMAIAPFLEALQRPKSPEGDRQARNVVYMQQQNDCLRREFAGLLPDVSPGLPWADAVFGMQAEAVNLWMGAPDSATSFHKDHYENMFAVVAGAKTFTALPPSDVYRLSMRKYPVARYVAKSLSGSASTHATDLTTCPLELTETDENSVSWSSVDPNCGAEERSQHPLFFAKDLPKALRIRVEEGDVLYLPSMWHHYVEQEAGSEGVCLGVNFWYDMRMGANFVNFNLAEKLSRLAQ